MQREYRYRFSVLWALLPITLFGGGCAFFIHLALENDRGLILNRIVELGVEGATVFYAVLAVASAALALGGVAGLVTPARTLVLTTTGIQVPSGFLGRDTRHVAFAQIRKVDEVNVSGTRILTLHLADKKVAINNRMLKDSATFEEVRAFVVQGVGAAQGGARSKADALSLG